MHTPFAFDSAECLAALRGGDRTRDTGNAPSRRVGTLLRQLMQQRTTAMDSATFDAEPLIARLRAAGALNSRPMPWLLRLLLRWRKVKQLPLVRGRWLAVLAGVALLIVVPRLWFSSAPTGVASDADDSATVMRGGEPAQRIAVPDPKARADRIAEVLARNALPMRRVEHGGQIEIQAKVPAGNAAVRELEALAVRVPDSGRMSLVIEKSR